MGGDEFEVRPETEVIDCLIHIKNPGHAAFQCHMVGIFLCIRQSMTSVSGRTSNSSPSILGLTATDEQADC